MVDNKHWGEAAESEAPVPGKEPGRPEAEEFYSEIGHRESVTEMPDGEAQTSSLEEEMGSTDTRIVGNSKAFEEEMDDL